MKNKNSFFNKDPYSFLFPLGIFSALLGVLLWLGSDQISIYFYPKQSHAQLMFFGFLWSFIAGFLMTAIPKMTQTQRAHPAEIGSAILLVICQWGLCLLNQIFPSIVIFILQTSVLIFFVIRRFADKKQMPFEGFIFIPISFILVFVGVGSVFFSSTSDYRLLYLFSGQAFVLNLICGIGGRLIPVLSRVPQSLNPDEKGQKSKMTEMLILAVVLNSSFVIEAFNLNILGWLVRAIVLVVISIRHFKILNKPSTTSFVGWGLRTAIVLMIGSYFGLAIFDPIYSLAFQHIVFIGGFTLITLMVATRVTLAHGGQNTELELHSKTIFILVFLLLLAAIARYKALTDISGNYFYIAVTAFSVGLIGWFVRFIKILMQQKH